MADTHQANDSRWMLRYEVAVDPRAYPRVHALLGQKGDFANDFAANMERLAQEYLTAVEQHLTETNTKAATETAAEAATETAAEVATKSTTETTAETNAEPSPGQP